MANTDRLNEVVALLVERDEEFRPFEDAQLASSQDAETLWSLTDLKRLLGYDEHESLVKALNKAKVSAEKAGISIRENFYDGGLFDSPGETFVTKYAAYLIIMNADVHKDAVAIAQNYFALKIDRQQLEDEKRLRTRLDVANENHKLQGVAEDCGVRDFQKFNGIGVSALYGGRSVKQIQTMKGLTKSQHYLDYAGSEELAANLFRITQTAAALRRQERPNEQIACDTHRKVGEGVRDVIVQSGNTPPERLPAASKRVDVVATAVKRRLKEHGA
jgi:DNA-damage-inducible protein D